MAPIPAVAIVIATYRRPHLLPRLIAALDAEMRVADYEMIVVDDASGDETGSVLERLRTSSRHRLVALRQKVNRGPAAARNRGWRASAAPLVVFTDDDCVPQPGWLAGLVDGLAEADVVQGRTMPDPAQLGRLGPFSRILDIHAHDRLYQTCNVGYRRELLERLGGFDESFRRPYGEDVDLGWRAREAGAVTAARNDAVVHHDVSDASILDHLRDLPRLDGAVKVLRAHPQLRAYLANGLFYDRSHPRAILAAAGLGIAAIGRSLPTSALGLAMLAPWLWYRAYRSPRPGTRRRRLDALPACLVADVAEVGALAAASIRHRTLML